MKFKVLDAPSNLGLRPPRPGHAPGVWRLPAALRGQGLVERIDADDGGPVPPPAYQFEMGPVTGFRNGIGLAHYSAALGDAVEGVVRGGFVPVVLGGDCSILLGNALALRRLGRFGLFFFDGHDDFSRHKNSPFYSAAGLDLALVTGRGPDQLVNLEKRRPYFQEIDCVAFGFQPVADLANYDPGELERTQIKTFGIEVIRERGLTSSLDEAIEYLSGRKLDGVWVHFDADVIRSAEMPAVDSPEPNGLAMNQAAEVIQKLMRSGLVKGLEITIFDPELDPDGSVARAFTNSLVEALR